MTTIWSTAISRLSSRITPQNFDSWLRPIECRSIEGSRIVLRAPNQWVRILFESNYLPMVLAELRQVQDGEFHVEFEIAETQPIVSAAGSTPEVPPAMVAAAGAEAPVSSGGLALVTSERLAAPEAPVSAPLPLPPGNIALNTKNTFDTFVVGPSNQLAHAAAQAVSAMSPPKYNPLFICGGAGLGKTHLLHAVGNAIRANRPTARILDLAGEGFMNEYINSLRTDRMREFRKRYREDCDVLLLDDIQFIAGKDSTQDEFFHTFNALHEQQRQIVLSADRKPIEIPDIADRLRTRFAMGLTADIEPPELEVRVAILRKKAASEGIPLPDEVSLYIAESIKSNVRELEGALIRLVAFASLSGRQITLDFAKESLDGIISRPTDHLSVDHVLKTVASYYNVKIADLKSERRHKSIAGPRAVAMYLARKYTGQSYPDLGRSIGNKHHTTVISACEKIAERLKTDLALRNEIQSLENLLER